MKADLHDSTMTVRRGCWRQFMLMQHTVALEPITVEQS